MQITIKGPNGRSAQIDKSVAKAHGLKDGDMIPTRVGFQEVVQANEIKNQSNKSS